MTGWWLVLALLGVGWVGLTVGFLGGAWWGTTAAVGQSIADQDHARFERDEAVRDAAWDLDEAGADR